MESNEKEWGMNMKKILIFAADIVIAVLIVAGIWKVNYRIPKKGIQAQTVLASLEKNKVKATKQENTCLKQQEIADKEQKIQSLLELGSNGMQATKVSLDTQDWHQKFADKFTDQIVSTDTSYTSPNLSVQLTAHSIQTDQLDTSANGAHKKYGKSISYVLADIYVGDITCLQTAFAQDTYGVGYEEKLTEMSNNIKSILATNGDSYSNSQHKDNGTIIRNGVIYRSSPTDMETCVLNWDGTMKIYTPDELNTQQLIREGAYQSWIFGPGLLDENGKARKSFLTWDYIRQSHPRTAIGYYEPGHYCLLVVDGRQENTRGMFLDEMAALFEQLGCKAAYNLDGGHCSFMTKGTQIVNHPYRPEHKIQDGIFLTEGI